MTRDPSLLMLIEAHTDTDGPDTANQGLSQQRADTVASYYTDAGINPERITAVGKGETNPLTQDTTPDGKARNRRIEVKLSTLAGN
jgi:OOP family OmpA-OmpF porin